MNLILIFLLSVAPSLSPPDNSQAFYGEESLKIVCNSLEYSQSVTDQLSKVFTTYELDRIAREFDKSSYLYRAHKMDGSEYLGKQYAIATYIYSQILKHIRYEESTYEIDKALSKNTANCLTYSQIYYVLCKTMHLDVVLFYSVEYKPGAHTACIVKCVDGNVIVVDLAWKYVSDIFIFLDKYEEFSANCYVVKSKYVSKVGKHHEFCLLKHPLALIYYEKSTHEKIAHDSLDALDRSLEIDNLFYGAYLARAKDYLYFGRFKEAKSDLLTASKDLYQRLEVQELDKKYHLNLNIP
jgi:hypothetical protein